MLCTIVYNIRSSKNNTRLIITCGETEGDHASCGH